jgi:hypothetical protein
VLKLVLAPVCWPLAAVSVWNVNVSDEIRASAGAHRDLGPGYENAVAEGLVERIGEEIDRRIDARLYGHLRAGVPVPQAPVQRRRESTGIGFGAVALGIGSMGLAVAATGVVLHPGWQGSDAGLAWLIPIIWIAIAAINITYARRRLFMASLAGRLARP